MKIAVGIDFSPESELAARQALDVARQVGGEVVLVHVAGTVELPAPGPRSDPSLLAAMDAYRATIARSVAHVRAQLEELRRRLSGQGPVVSHVLADGFPDAGLRAAADGAGADLIMVGTHGRTGLRWFFLGSVAQDVVRTATTDVLVARGEQAARGGYHRILVATDFSPASERALDRALELAAPGGTVDVVHFHHLPLVVGTDALTYGRGPIEASLTDELQARGDRMLAARRKAGGPTLQFHVRHGFAVPGAVHWLEERPSGLAAVGSHGRRGFRGPVLGSVAEAVVRRAPCSVLIAHDQSAED